MKLFAGVETRALQAAQLPFKVGDTVEVGGLQGAPQHNGKQGVVQRFDAEKGRFVLKVAGLKKPLAVKPENLAKAGSESPKEKRKGESQAATSTDVKKTSKRPAQKTSKSQLEAAWGELERSLLQEIVQYTKPASRASSGNEKDGRGRGEVTSCRLFGKDLVSAAAVNKAWRKALHWTEFPECQAWAGVLPGMFNWRLLATAPRSLLELHRGQTFFDESVREDADDDEREIYEQIDIDLDQLFGMPLGAETDNQVALTTLTKRCPGISQLHLNGAVHPWTMQCLSRFRNLRALDCNYVKCPWENVFHVGKNGPLFAPFYMKKRPDHVICQGRLGIIIGGVERKAVVAAGGELRLDKT